MQVQLSATPLTQIRGIVAFLYTVQHLCSVRIPVLTRSCAYSKEAGDAQRER